MEEVIGHLLEVLIQHLGAEALVDAAVEEELQQLIYMELMMYVMEEWEFLARDILVALAHMILPIGKVAEPVAVPDKEDNPIRPQLVEKVVMESLQEYLVLW